MSVAGRDIKTREKKNRIMIGREQVVGAKRRMKILLCTRETEGSI